MSSPIPETDPRERELGIAWSADKIRQIRLAVEALKSWEWALRYKDSLQVEDIERHYEEAQKRLASLVQPHFEYGTQWSLSEKAHGVWHTVVYPEQSREAGLETIREDTEVSGSKRGVLVRRRAASAWEETT